jgi:hypothetical protein
LYRGRPTFRTPPPAAAGIFAVTLLLVLPHAALAVQGLRGSTASLDHQNRVAREHDYTYIDTGDRVRHFALQGWLVRVEPTADFRLHGVSFPFARAEVDLFLRRLASQYRSACGEELVVTSLTRPTTRQPRNASDRSVHPTGMAADIRYSRDGNCRRWIERVLVDLERAGVLDATRERYPLHYHVALFPRQYTAYVGVLQSRAVEVEERVAYTVRSGDSLWAIARRMGTTIDRLKAANGLDDNRIFVGQQLDVPLGS